MQNIQIGVPKESSEGETRVAISPELVKKFKQKSFEIIVESGAGDKACFSDSDYSKHGAVIGDRAKVLAAPLVVKINPPNADEISKMKSGSWLISMLEPYATDFTKLAQAGINAVAMELVPRTSRAQSMDVLSSQANIAGYRAVLEAVAQYPRFFPMMMTSAGMARPAKLIVLGVGVAGLQAIATARRLGALVEAFDVRPEVKEQILSLGAKFVEINVGESGTGSGGYAKELSPEAKAKQQGELTERLKKYDVVVTTANIPGRKAPILVTEEAVKGMRQGSVIIDMAAPTGGNCELTQPGKIIEKHGVKIVGLKNYAALVPSDSSQFYGANVLALLELLVQKKESGLELVANFEDDIVAATVVTYQGQVRRKG
jgi:NAD(P) transhydrogenase subunit alpha